MSASGLPAPQREWQRFTPGERLARFAVYLSVVAAAALCVRSVEVSAEFLRDAPAQIGDLLQRMSPVAFGFYPTGIHLPLLQSLHIATLGTAASVLMAIPLALLAARNVTPSVLLNYLAKLVLVSVRSGNTLIWALFFVALVGPGALAGVLAIAVHSIGFTGKLVAEALEETDRDVVAALHATGAPWSSVMRYAYWPQIKPVFWGVVLFRWDKNVRESTVLGLVGAGGLGMALDTAMNLLQWNRVAMILLTIFIVVIAAEIVTTWVRGWIR